MLQLEALRRRVVELEQALQRLQRVQELMGELDRAWAAETPMAHALRAAQRAFEADGVWLIRLDAQGRPARWWHTGWEECSSDDFHALLQFLLEASRGAPEGSPQILPLAERIPALQVPPAPSAMILRLRDPWGDPGLLAFWKRGEGGFAPEVQELARAAAEPLAVRLHALHILEQHRYLNRAVTLLFRVARVMASSPEISITLPQVVRILREETGWPYVALLVYEPAAQQLRAMAWEGEGPAADVNRPGIPATRGIVGRALRTGESQRVPDVSMDPDSAAEDPPTRSELAVPIFEGEAPWGVLDARSPERYAFTPDDEAMMLAVAGTISLGLEAARVYERVRRERTQVRMERDRLIALYEGYLALQQHPDPERALEEAVGAFIRLGWRAARGRVLDESGRVLAVHESIPAPRFPPSALEPWLRTDARLERYRHRGRLYLFPPGDPTAREVLKDGEEASVSRVVLPLLDAEGRLLGLMELEPPEGGEALEEPLARPTELLAALLAIAFDRGRLLRRYAQRLREQTMLYRAVSALLRSGEPDPILVEIAAALCEALEGTSAYFLAVHPARRVAWVAAEHHAESAHLMERTPRKGVVYPEKDIPLKWAALRGRQVQALYADDPPDAYEPERDLLRRYGGWSALVVPLWVGEEPLGVVEVWDSRRRRAFDAGERALAQAIAQHAAIAFQRARLHEQLRQANRRLEAILSTVEDALILLDREGRIVQMNAAARRLIAGAELLPEGPLPDLLRRLRRRAPAAARALARGLRQIRREKAGGFRVELSFPLSDSVRWFALMCSQVHDDDPMGGGWLLVCRDITAERERDRLREEMLRMLMHDLQNPLGPIHLALEELVSYPELSREARSMVQTALRGLRRLQDLIGSLLDIARLETGRLPVEWEPLDLRGLVEEVVEDWGPMFSHRMLQVNVELSPELPWIWVDRQLITRVLSNLLSNAVKFTPAGGRIHIRAYPHGGMAVLEVFNSGSYIPPEQRLRIFERFTTMPGRGGYGLGLAFAKLAVEAHGGRIEVESDASGTTFTIRLPLRPAGSA